MCKCLAFILLLALFSQASFCHNISVSLQQTELHDAIMMIAKLADLNVVLSNKVSGYASLNLRNVKPVEAFNLLLVSHGLMHWKVGDIWVVGSQEDLTKYQAAYANVHALAEEQVALQSFFCQIRYGKADQIVSLMREKNGSLLSKRGSVYIDDRTNVIFVRDIKERIITIKNFINHIDKPTPQVVIKARLVSIDSDYERELGIRFKTQKVGKRENGYPNDSPSRSQTGIFTIASFVLADSSQLDIKLAALENAGHAELISTPSLFTSHQQTASIESGEEVPYQEVSESGGTAIAFKKAVLSLKVTPQVLPGSKVLLHLQINQDRPNNRMVQGMPTINTRQIITHATIASGETIVLGGIYEQGREHNLRQIPFLSQIPLLGWLFKEQNIQSSKRELLIFVTPEIVV